MLAKCEASITINGAALLRAISAMFDEAQLNPTVADIVEHPRKPDRFPHAAS